MTFGSLSKTLTVTIALAAFPMFAATKERAVRPLAEVTVTGTITDATTGNPIAGAQAVNGVRNSAPTGTDGVYSIKVPIGRPTTLSAKHFAYNTSTQTVTPNAGTTANFSLTSLPAVTVKLTSGESHVLDLATSQFAYLIVFSGYARNDAANFCRADGTTWTPNKTEFAKITGPGKMVTNTTCCNLGPVVSINVEMKSGEKAQVIFGDSCFGNEVDFLGRERSTGTFLYFRFLDIAEIDFP